MNGVTILKKKRILITNDDGFEAKGIKALIEALKGLAHITVVAPATEKSACAHSVTLKEPLRLIEVKKDHYKVDDGTPSDCVYISREVLFRDHLPDLVISGINEGSNMGEDITYSGTVAGAMEGVLQGIPSIAISQVIGTQNRDKLDFRVAGEFIRKIVKKFFKGEYPLSDRELLNINVPPSGDIKKATVTYAGYRIYGNDTHIYNSPRGERLYWLGLHPLEWTKRKVDREFKGNHSDFDAVDKGLISVTPIKLDLTAYERVEKVAKWLK
jgi:5'-nucleotidase